MKRTSVILADEHLILLEGLRRLLEERFEIFGSVQNGAELMQLARKSRPDMIVTEVNLPGVSGTEAVQKLQQEQNPAKVVFLTMFGGMDIVLRAFRSGGGGYVLKQSACSELVLAMDEVLAGRTYITPRIARDVVGVAIHSSSFGSAANGPLTKRQAEVLRLVAQGKTMKEVAAELGISTRTAEAHKYQMMDHLNVRTVPELIQQGIGLGFVDVPQPARYAAALGGHANGQVLAK